MPGAIIAAMVLYENRGRLLSVLETVRSSPRSDFYREKFATLPVMVDSIEQLPFLTRNELVAIPPDDRCYIPRNELAFVAYTSGTTSGQPLLSFFGTVDNYHVDPTWGVVTERILVVFPPLNKNFCGTFIQQCRESVHPVTPVFGDPANLAASAYLGQALHVDALYATPSLAFALAPYLAKTGLHQKIRLLVISGETITNEQRVSLQALYPEAYVANLYASSEIGQFIMGPTRAMLEDKTPGFVLLTEALVAAELVDSELVVTYAENPAFPLIRYRTGDLFTIETDWTKKYGTKTPVLSWLGKGGVDVVRVHGTEIRSGSVDTFFTNLALPISQYQLHIFPGQAAATLDITLEYIVPEVTVVDVAYIQNALLDNFYIRPGQTIRAAITAGVVESIHVKPVDVLSWQGAKRRVLVNHVT